MDILVKTFATVSANQSQHASFLQCSVDACVASEERACVCKDPYAEYGQFIFRNEKFSGVPSVEALKRWSGEVYLRPCVFYEQNGNGNSDCAYFLSEKKSGNNLRLNYVKA